tara:strand:+ start:567 stop:941 length:375 start_codon:yes stop_codon:yes gene_type:complete
MENYNKNITEPIKRPLNSSEIRNRLFFFPLILFLNQGLSSLFLSFEFFYIAVLFKIIYIFFAWGIIVDLIHIFKGLGNIYIGKSTFFKKTIKELIIWLLIFIVFSFLNLPSILFIPNFSFLNFT